MLYKVDNGSWNSITTIYNTTATNYSYSWQVPDVAPSNLKIMIRSYWYANMGGALYWTDSSDVVSPSVNPSGTITVLTPNGGVSMNALTNYNITWTANGTSGFYDVQYSTNGGTSYSTIVSNITGTAYSWNVVNNPGANVLIRVRDNQNNCRKDASDAANTIVVATPALTSPNGGEVWNVNSTQNITWNTSTIISGGSVYIEYSSDNGTNWNIISSGTSNTGSYAWTIPNIPTTQALVRISNVGYLSNNDVSNAVFTIQTPQNFLTYPNGGEQLRAVQAYNITWDANAFISPVKLEYSLNSGSTWNTIVASYSNTGSYSWTTPQIVTTTTCLVRITNTTVGTIQDVSDAVFTILAPVTVDYPNLGTSLTTCSNINIQWSRTTNFANYNETQTYYKNTYELLYKVDNGSWNSITTMYNSTATNYSYSWQVPDVAPSTLKIMIRSYWYANMGGALYWIDSSDVVSPAVNPSGTITVTNPNGGVTLNALTTYYVTWTGNGTSGFYDILYSTNGGTSYNTIATNVTGTSYAWNVNNNPGTNVFVRVRDNQNTCRKDASDFSNTITAAMPVLTSPNGGEVWNVNSTHNITWNTNTIISGGSVFIEYSLDNGVTYNTVIASTPNTGSYSWTLPYVPTTQAKIRISVVGEPTLYDICDAPFTILVPTPVVTSPNGGETWYAGEIKNITWLPATFFSNTVNIQYSLDAGSTWVNIATNQSNSGSYSWTLPSLNSANALIKVSNYTNTAVYDVSDALLTLRPWVRIITPNGGEILGSCTQTTIAFEKAPTHTSFNIEYSVDNGSNWIALQTNQTYTNTINTYSWTIPNSPTTQALVRVTPYSYPAKADISDAAFTIKKAVTIVQPNYGGVLVIGSSYPIEWLSDGISNIYDLAYSTAGPTGPFTNIVLGFNTSNNTYSWTVPNTPSTNCYLRIRDNVNSCKEDISDLAFTISATANPITVTAPDGGDTLSACQAYNITWTESGAPIGNYNISYSIDYGVNWVPIVSNLITTSGYYNWIVPNVNVSGALIRVQSGLNPLVFDYSNALFMIKPGRLFTNEDVTICSGSSVQLNTSGGSNYSWSPSAGLSNTTIPNPIATPSGTTQYTVTSNSSGCFLQDTVLLTVLPSTGLTAGVSISPSTGTAICSGTPVLFVATPANGGSTPAYTWKKNGTTVGTNTYTYTDSGLASGDVITCILTSSEQCVANNPATSNAVTMTVFQNVIPSVSISTASSSVCAGTNVTFTATPVNGGASPSYQWKKNGNNVGSNSNIYTDATLANLDLISVEMLSNASCASPQLVSSNSILMTVNPNTTPTVVISTPSSTICSGTTAAFTATANNAGTTPVYQWKINGMNTGSNSSTYTSATLVNNNQISCTVISSNTCNTVNPVSSSAITMTVLPSPSAPVASSNSPVSSGTDLNLYASTIADATYYWTGPNGFSSSAQNPVIPNATTSMSGKYYVSATVNGCSSPADSTVVTVSFTPLPVTISGVAISEAGSFINGVKLKLTGAEIDSMYTSANGQYQFDVLQGASQVITPSKNNDLVSYNGISSFDIILMQRHIGAAQLLGSPYKIIAADVNSSGTVNVIDISMTKALILQNITSFPGNKLWSFVNSSYVFADPIHPFPYENSRSYSNATAASDQNFIGVKLGDVNNSWDPFVSKALSSEIITMSTQSMETVNGAIVEVPVTVKDFNNISGFQYTLSWDPEVLEFVDANNAALNMDYGTLQTSNGKLTTLWATDDLNGLNIPDGQAIFVLKFRVIGNAGASSAISINSDITLMEAVNKDLEEVTINVEAGLVKVIGTTGIDPVGSEECQLFQNEPNPFASSTKITFSIPVRDEVSIFIYDIFGKEVAEFKGIYDSGKHSIIWDGTDQYGSRLSVGTYYCRLQTGNYIKVRKMILFK
ncbi:MAG TPA: T9SS type A sorting domain-containing protein [Bacteroidales bacterium]|nr:T9SS type A sorting domain-containing protein [Bacteroidales bacterium]